MNLARTASKRAALVVSRENALTEQSLTGDESFSTRLSLVRSLPLFHHSSEESLLHASRLLETVHLKAGVNILNQGDTVLEDDVFFILVDGEATVYIRPASSRRSGPGFRVARLTPGDVFGHEALVTASRMRGGTVVASTACTCYVGDRQLLMQVVANIPPSMRRSVLTHFSDLRREDTASLEAYAHQIREVIKSVGAEVLAFELEQDQLIRQTKTSNKGVRNSAIPHMARTMSTSQGLAVVDDWSILMMSGGGSGGSGGKSSSNDIDIDNGNGNNNNNTTNNNSFSSSSDAKMSQEQVSNNTNKRAADDATAMVSNIFTQRHVDLLRKMIPTATRSNSDDDDDEDEKKQQKEEHEVTEGKELQKQKQNNSNKKVNTNKIDPRRQRLLDVNRLILDECIAHRRRMDAMDRHHLSSLAEEAVARKKQGSDAASMHITGSYVPELSAGKNS